MKLEEQVTNLELSKKLKELGVTQESLYFWAVEMKKGRETSKWSLCISEHLLLEHPKYSAFTVAELGEMLPEDIKGDNDKKAYLDILKIHIGGFWELSYSEISERCTVNPIRDWSEANARAKMLIYLLENKLRKI